MRRFALLGLALAACSHSSVTGNPLEVDGVTPASVSARGGAVIRVHGKGFHDGARLFVEGLPVTASLVDGDTLEGTMPPAFAGRAEVRVEQDGDVASLANALEIQAIPLAFADAPAFVLPTLPGPVEHLAATPAGLLLGGAWGLHAATWADGKLVSTPVAALVGEGATSLPKLLALAATARGDHVAICADDAKVLHWLSASESGLVETSSGGTLPGTCEALAIGTATPSDPAVFIRVSTPDGPRLLLWHPGTDPAPLATPPLPANVDAWLAADLDGDGDDDLALASADGTVAWTRESAAFSAEGAFPPKSARSFAFAAIDPDHDGDVDVYVAGEGSDALFLNDGHGRFVDDAFRRLPFERATGRAAAIADFDRDGRDDVFVGTPDGLDRLYLGGPDAFTDGTPQLGLDPARGATRAALLDLDHDGDTDVVTVDAAGKLRVRWLVDPPAP